ncbi:g1678 [Coccomyxa elongata]
MFMSWKIQTGRHIFGDDGSLEVSQDKSFLSLASNVNHDLSDTGLSGKEGLEQQGVLQAQSATPLTETINGVRILDCFIYNGEMIAALRLEYLYDVVEEIIVVESRTTFSGNIKPQLFIERDAHLFRPYLTKVEFLVLDDYPEPDQAWLATRANRAWMTDLSVWFRETYQRNFAQGYIKEKYAGQKYVVLACDVDEIPSREVVAELRSFRYEHAHIALYFEMEMSYYNFNWTARYQWYHAFAVSDVGLAKKTLDDYRTENSRYHLRRSAGWHLSYYMGISELARKIESFSHKELNLPEYKAADHIVKCIRTGKDLFDRGSHFDMLPAGPELQANRPEGWQGFAKHLAKMQEP